MAGNEHTFYTFSDNPLINLPQEIALNRAVLRVPVTATSSADALSPAELPVIHGDPGIPVLSVHGIGDLFVPFSMDQQYDAMMVAHGQGGLFVDRAIREVTHCGYTTSELSSAFSALVSWIDTGKRAAGDNILNPKTVASPTVRLPVHRPHSRCPPGVQVHGPLPVKHPALVPPFRRTRRACPISRVSDVARGRRLAEGHATSDTTKEVAGVAVAAEELDRAGGDGHPLNADRGGPPGGPPGSLADARPDWVLTACHMRVMRLRQANRVTRSSVDLVIRSGRCPVRSCGAGEASSRG